MIDPMHCSFRFYVGHRYPPVSNSSSAKRLSAPVACSIAPSFKPSRCLPLQPVECPGIVVIHFLFHILGKMTRVFGDDLFGEWPSAVGMRIIRAPHDVAVAEELGQVKSDQIRLKSRPNLALENLDHD